jgi:hypothetical protein
MRFEIEHGLKRLIFDSDLHGLRSGGREYLSDRDGVLIYDQTRDLKGANQVEVQMSTNTSTLIPGLRTLGLPYSSYFDDRPVVDSQNDITFYWKPSKLAAFYNRFSTDELDYADREPVIRQAVDFLRSNPHTLPLPEELLARMSEPSRLLGFAKLQSRLGVHLDPETVMISTPLDKYESDVYELAKALSKETGLGYSKKKNRVIFPKDEKLLERLGIKEG